MFASKTIKTFLCASAAVLTLGLAHGAIAADSTDDMSASSKTATDTPMSSETDAGKSNATMTDKMGSTDDKMAATDTTTTTKTMTKKPMHKKHMKHKAHKKEVMNSAPGDVKTSNDDSGMKPDAAVHDKAAVSTMDKASDNQ